MIVKMNNQKEKFYFYMGEVFGSRKIQNDTKDRFFDDDTKEWYLFLKEEKVVACISINNTTIKNVYAKEEECLERIFVKILKDKQISPSIVTNKYETLYKKVGLKVKKPDGYKNYIMISV